MRTFRSARVLIRHALRARTVLALAAFAGLAALTLLLGRGAAQYGPNLALNLAAEFVGAFVILFVLTPILRRAQHGDVREHRRLDFDWYITRVLLARERVRILHTFSRLLAPPFDQRFLRGAAELLARHGQIQILLLDPDSPAAAQRTAELAGRGDVSLETRRNLRILHRFREGLDERGRSRFQVRLYQASPSVQIYQWDDRLLASFFPYGKLSGDGSQLELAVDSPLGDFLGERFAALWEHARPLADYASLRVVVAGGAGPRRYSSPFVTVDGDHYLSDPRLMAHLATSEDRHVTATVAGHPGVTYRLDVAVDGPRAAAAADRFRQKYDEHGETFVRLVPHDGGRAPNNLS